MCTLSWIRQEEGYDLWFNRDELNSRAEELPPALYRTADGVEWLAPEDPDSGGTWLMINAHGVTCVLLNRYPSGMSPLPDEPARPRSSRGRLAPLAADATTAEQAIETIRREPFAGMLGFHVVALDPSGGISEVRWDGVAGHLAAGSDILAPLTSSSHRTVEVTAARRASYPDHPTIESLEEYHHAHDPADGALSVNMCRADASTRSIAHVRVTADRVDLDYEPQGWWIEDPAPPSRHRLTRLKPVSLNS